MTHQMTCLGCCLAVPWSGQPSKHLAIRRTFPQPLKISASLRWKFPICLTGFLLVPKLDDCLESYSLSSWNEQEKMLLFPLFFFIWAEWLTLRSMMLVLHCFWFTFIYPCAPVCHLFPLLWQPLLHLFPGALVSVKYTVGVQDWWLAATQSPLLGKTSLSFYGTRADVKKEGKSLWSHNLNRFGTGSEVLPIGQHIKPSLCNVDLIVLAFV